MAKINEAERKTQDRVLGLFRDKAGLGYEYYGNLRRQINTNVMEDKLKEFLIGRGYSENLAERAIRDLVLAAGNLQQGLYNATSRRK